jgi:hypothetical protein
MAPATLIDRNIQWEILDSLTVKAKYTNGNIKISAKLVFNEKGELINFISNDRFETADGKIYHNYPWKTPIRVYSDLNGMKVASSASTIYHRTDSDFCYGRAGKQAGGRFRVLIKSVLFSAPDKSSQRSEFQSTTKINQ